MLIFIIFVSGFNRLINLIEPLRELNEIFVSYNEDTGNFGAGILDLLGVAFGVAVIYAVYKALKLFAKSYWGLNTIDRDKIIIILEKEFKIRSKIDSLLKNEKSKTDNIRRMWALEEVKQDIEYVLSLWENPYCGDSRDRSII
ncbi:MAG TPA: hypothetical protein VGB72_08970 [Acidobacteriota bacterium]